jgi:hypothetical protein
MQRKQQVGECWVCVIFFACVCVGASDMKIASDDPSSSSPCVVCTRCFPRGVLVGGKYAPPWLHTTFEASPRFFFGQFLLFLTVL